MSRDSPETKPVPYPPDFFVAFFEPYTFIYEIVQGMLFWRRPVLMTSLLVCIEVFAFSIFLFDLGTLSVLCLSLGLLFLLRTIWNRFQSTLSLLLLPEIEPGQPNESNRIYPLLPFCEWLSFGSEVFAAAWKAIPDTNGDPSSLVVASGLFAILFMVFNTTGTFWTFWTIGHAVLLVPGVLMHPAVFSSLDPYLGMFKAAIGYPYVHSEGDSTAE
jgi:hypothetical protein